MYTFATVEHFIYGPGPWAAGSNVTQDRCKPHVDASTSVTSHIWKVAWQHTTSGAPRATSQREEPSRYAQRRALASSSCCSLVSSTKSTLSSISSKTRSWSTSSSFVLGSRATYSAHTAVKLGRPASNHIYVTPTWQQFEGDTVATAAVMQIQQHRTASKGVYGLPEDTPEQGAGRRPPSCGQCAADCRAAARRGSASARPNAALPPARNRRCEFPASPARASPAPRRRSALTSAPRRMRHPGTPRPMAYTTSAALRPVRSPCSVWPGPRGRLRGRCGVPACTRTPSAPRL